MPASPSLCLSARAVSEAALQQGLPACCQRGRLCSLAAGPAQGKTRSPSKQGRSCLASGAAWCKTGQLTDEKREHGLCPPAALVSLKGYAYFSFL